MFWKYSSRIAVGQHSLLGHRHWGLQKSWISVFWEWPSPLKHLRVMDVSIVSKTLQYRSDHVFICVLDAEAATRDLRSQCVRSCDAHFWKLPRWH
jgi:hypothetical protein